MGCKSSEGSFSIIVKSIICLVNAADGSSNMKSEN